VLSAVIFPVRGFSDGTFSIVMVKRALSVSTSIVCTLRQARRASPIQFSNSQQPTLRRPCLGARAPPFPFFPSLGKAEGMERREAPGACEAPYGPCEDPLCAPTAKPGYPGPPLRGARAQ